MIDPAAFSAFLASEGLFYEQDVIGAFLLSIRTRPFVILAGLSGTGKTALPRRLAAFMDTEEESTPIAVSPDWQDNSDVMGFIDLNNVFRPGEFVELAKKATENPGKLYVAILDEMNLAPVEQYFAHFLSMLESRRYDDVSDRVIATDYCFNEAVRNRLRADPAAAVYADLHLPDNLVVVGTVNVDESTAPFSRKVLDRANVIQLDRVDLAAGLPPAARPAFAGDRPAVADVVGKVTNLTELVALWPRIVPAVVDMETHLRLWVAELQKFVAPLNELRGTFGLRVRDDVCTYLSYSASLPGVDATATDWWRPAFDQQLMQRILPRIVAEQAVSDASMVTLISLCAGAEISSEQEARALDIRDGAAPYPQAGRHLQSRLRKLVENELPIVGFW